MTKWLVKNTQDPFYTDFRGREIRVFRGEQNLSGNKSYTESEEILNNTKKEVGTYFIYLVS